MADNIKILGNITNTTVLPRYSEKDIVLLQSQNLQNNFGGSNDNIEYYIYDAGGNLLNINYNYLSYKLSPLNGLTPAVNTVPNTTGNIESNDVVSTYTPTSGSTIPIIEIDPIQDLQNAGYSSGEFKVQYNLFTNILSNSVDRALFVKEISGDRTEIRLASTTLTNDEIKKVVDGMIDNINNSSYYVDYLLNFGDNKQYTTVNVALNPTPEGNEVLFKLYEPLPPNIQEKDILWVVQEKASPYVFDLNLDKLIIPPPLPTLRGPNFDIEVENQGTVSTSYKNYQTLVSGLQSLQNSSYQQILNLLATQSVSINTDYTDFNNFVFFGSSYQRVYNFYNKVKNIEDSQNFITAKSPLTSSTPSLIIEINQISSSINDTISKFDGYESYLYFESSSYTWPKSNSSKPYTLLSTGSATTLAWYNALTSSAEYYDKNNYNNLEYSVPTFVKDDENNTSYLTFLNMVGHYFDNIWIYLQAITDINLANNNLNKGISKDLVYEQLKSLGIKLYNSQAGEDTNQYLIGANTGSSTWDNNTTSTGSYLNNIPRKDLVSELYKRIYHNLPLLLKTKGTVEGLDNLITIFGIPNKTYYTVGSSSFYTPTGSSATASILNVKEYGGSLKKDLIKGYNNDKVRIVSNEIVTGSVLSPIMSLQTYPTASTQFRDDDLHFVDISFSPQNQINTYISKSINSNNPSWSLDNYIGDPRYIYSSSYDLLDTERRKYYQTGVTGYAPFTASALDYNGFIRLIEYFDNALFKMLSDFVPERTSVSTGVTFESPVLERNKSVYANPTNTTTQSVYEANYSTSSMSSDYGHFYDFLENDKKAWYDGNITGSYINVYDYFENSNPNPYLQAISASLTTASIYTFLHSDFNVLLNNVSKNVTSLIRNNIEYTYGTTRSIIYPAELQDSYLTLQSYNNSRYEGTKLVSLKYNTYTSASYTGSDGFNTLDGDQSYGKTAVVDRHVRKIGLFTRIESSSFLPKRNTVALKYLVDEFGGLTELNQRNNHWEDVQRTFLMSSRPNVSLFDNKKYNNQKSTDGNKLIFDSGYTYAPILYFATCSLDHYLSFEGTNDEPSSYTATAKNSLNPNAYVSGSTSPHYPIISSYIMNLFDSIIEGSEYFNSGSTTTFPSYSVKETSDYNILADIPVTFTATAPPAISSSWYLQVYKKSSGIETLIAEDQYTWIIGDPAAVTLTWTSFTGTRFIFQVNQPILSQNISIAGAYVEGFTDSGCSTVPSYAASQISTATLLAGNTFVSVGKTAPSGWPTSVCWINNLASGLTINGTPVLWGGTITLASGCVITVQNNITSCQFIC